MARPRRQCRTLHRRWRGKGSVADGRRLRCLRRQNLPGRNVSRAQAEHKKLTSSCRPYCRFATCMNWYMGVLSGSGCSQSLRGMRCSSAMVEVRTRSRASESSRLCCREMVLLFLYNASLSKGEEGLVKTLQELILYPQPPARKIQSTIANRCC